jgi:hypothetical protein
MDQKEVDLWKIVDVGGYAAYGTFFSLTMEALKSRIEKDNKDIQELRDRIALFHKNISKRFQDMNLNLFDKKIFPVDTLRELRDGLFPEMGAKFKELDSILKYFLSGSSHLKGRVISKVKECEELITKMGELGQKFSKNDRYWEYRKTNPVRVQLERPEN